MPEVSLPNISLQWAQGGDILKPSDSKIQQGWGVEIPPRQWFNWLDNRQDQAIAHIAQHGIAVWSADIEYQANKSYVQGSDGLIYKALTTHTNINPVGAAPGTWQSAFLTADQATQVASAAQSRAMTANNVYLSPLQLNNAFTSSSKQSMTANGYQIFPGGLILQWGIATAVNGSGSWTYPLPFPNSVFRVFASQDATNPQIVVSASPSAASPNTSASITSSLNSGSDSFYLLALGF